MGPPFSSKLVDIPISIITFYKKYVNLFHKPLYEINVDIKNAKI